MKIINKERLYESLQKKWGVDAKYIIENGFFLYSASFTSILIKTLLGFALLSFLSVRDYGVYNLVFSIIGVLTIFSLPELGTAITREVSRKGGNFPMKLWYVRIKCSLLGSLGLLIAAGYIYFFQESMATVIIFFVGAFLFPLYKSSDLFMSYLSGKEEFKKRSLYSIIATLTVDLGAFVMLILFRDVIFLTLFLFLTTTVVNCWFIFRDKEKDYETDYSEALHYGKHLTYSSIIITIADHIDKLILGFFLGLEVLAIFAASRVLNEFTKSLIKASMPLVIPKFSRMDTSSFLGLMKRTVLPILILCGVFMTILYFCIPLLYSFFKADYLISIPYAQLLLLNVPPLALTFLANQYIKAKGHVKTVYHFNFVSSIARIVLTAVFIAFAGLPGAILSLVIQRYFILFYSFGLVYFTRSV